MAKQILIHTAGLCPNCETTKKLFDKERVKYETIDLTNDEPAREILRQEGNRAFPVVHVKVDGVLVDSWDGLNIPKIKKTAWEYNDVVANPVID